MSPERGESDSGAGERQQGRRLRWSRRTQIGAAAAAAAIGVAVVASTFGALRGQTSTTPADETPASAQTPVPTGPTIAPDGADRVGLVGLALAGAKPSLPKTGELVLGFTFGRTMGDQGRFRVFVYADGRLIWQRFGDATNYSTGLLEQRLTLEGVELVTAEMISTGLFDHDLHLESGQGLNYGNVDFRNGNPLVHVTWGSDVGPDDVARTMPTPRQASALQRLDALLADPARWLPASAWKDPGITAYVPSGYSVCYQGEQGVGLSRVLASLPPSAEDLLRTQDRTQGEYTNLLGPFVYWCSDLTNEESRALARILDDAGLNGFSDVFGLRYGETGMTEVSLEFAPLLPHDET
jgi:hypothetical protein